MSNIVLRNALIAAGVVGAGTTAAAQSGSAVTALTPTVISGYVDTSAIWLIGNQDGSPNLPGRSFDGPDKQDGFNLNVVKLGLEKPLDDSAWSAGYKVDLLFGPDATGWNNWINADDSSDFSVRQAYVTLRADVGNGLDFKVGTFDTIIGYEVYEAGENPNYSRSYGYYIEPTQHTGVLVSYNLTDWLAVNAGIANTYDARINARPMLRGETASESRKAYMGSVVLTAPEDAGWLAGAALYGGVVTGLGIDGSDNGNKTSVYGGLTLPTPITGVSFGAAYDYRFLNTVDGEQWATALGGYIIWQATERLKLANRVEYATGTAGTWDSSEYWDYYMGYSGARRPGVQDEFLGVTSTVDYSLWANVISRLEFRWDHDLASGVGAFGKYNRSGDYHGLDNALSVALNLIYKF